MFGGTAAMMTAQLTAIVSRFPGVRIAEPTLLTSATGLTG